MKDPLFPYAVGVVGWLVGLLALFGLSWPLSSPESFSTAVMWAIQHWWAAFALGLVMLIVAAAITRTPLRPSLTGYLFPVFFMAILAMACLWVFPDSGFRNDLSSFMPVIVIFYLLSLVWLRLRGGATPGSNLARSLAPPVFGGIMILGLVAVPVFASNAYIYHKAFRLEVRSIKHSPDSMVAQCVLEIRKPGDYVFQAPKCFYFDMVDGLDQDPKNSPRSVIVWGKAGKPTAGATGSFPFELVWENIPQAMRSDLAAMPVEALPLLVEARSSANPDEVLYTVNAENTPIQEAAN